MVSPTSYISFSCLVYFVWGMMIKSNPGLSIWSASDNLDCLVFSNSRYRIELGSSEIFSIGVRSDNNVMVGTFNNSTREITLSLEDYHSQGVITLTGPSQIKEHSVKNNIHGWVFSVADDSQELLIEVCFNVQCFELFHLKLIKHEYIMSNGKFAMFMANQVERKKSLIMQLMFSLVLCIPTDVTIADFSSPSTRMNLIDNFPNAFAQVSRKNGGSVKIVSSETCFSYLYVPSALEEEILFLMKEDWQIVKIFQVETLFNPLMFCNCILDEEKMTVWDPLLTDKLGYFKPKQSLFFDIALFIFYKNSKTGESGVMKVALTQFDVLNRI